MKEIAPQLTDDLKSHFGDSVTRGEPYPAGSFTRLARFAAELAFLNRGNLLLYRGQREDHRNKAGATSLYASIYRKGIMGKARRDQSIRLLATAQAELVARLALLDRKTAEYIGRRPLLQHAVLETFGVCATPLLPFTFSLRAACSFALRNRPGSGDDDRKGVVYIAALPYLRHGITVDAEAEISLVHASGALPAHAAGPFSHETVFAGAAEGPGDYGDKNELDFNRRLVAKFTVTDSAEFWDGNEGMIPGDFLAPARNSDPIRDLCVSIRNDLLEREGVFFDFE